MRGRSSHGLLLLTGQLAWSSVSLVIMVALARTSSLAELGRWSLLAAAAAWYAGTVRSVYLDPLGVELGRGRAVRVHGSLVPLVATAAPAALLAGAIGGLVPAQGLAPLLAVAIVAGDVGRVRAALRGDVLGVALHCGVHAAIAVALLVDGPGGMAGSASVGAVVAFAWRHLAERDARAPAAPRSPSLGLEFVVANGGYVLVHVVLGLLAGASEVGILRLGLLPAAPVGAVVLAAYAAALRGSDTIARLVPGLVAVGLALVVANPWDVLGLVLGQDWAPARPVAALLLLAQLANHALMTSLARLRRTTRRSSASRERLVSGVLSVACAVPLSHAAGATGAALALLVGPAVAALLVRRRRTTAPGSGVDHVQRGSRPRAGACVDAHLVDETDGQPVVG